jgi:hypothetical protein
MGTNIWFHRFPKKGSWQYTKWEIATQRGSLEKFFDTTKINNMHVCSKHFCESDYDSHSYMRYKLLRENGEKNIIAPKLLPHAVPRSNNVTCISLRVTKTVGKREVERVLQSEMDSGINTKEPVGVDRNIECIPGPSTNNAVQESLLRSSHVNINEQCDEYMSASDVIMSDNESTGSEFECDTESESTSGSEDEENVSSKTKDSHPYATALIFMSCLEILFKICHVCGSRTTSVNTESEGSNIKVTTHCHNGCDYVWNGQPTVNEQSKQRMGNILIPSVIYTSGITLESFISFAKGLNLFSFCSSTYHCVKEKYIEPILINEWFHEREKNIDEAAKRRKIKIAADGQYDSPRHCADLCTYTALDLDTNKVIDFIVLKRGTVTGDLEKKACEIIINRLLEKFGENFEIFVSDRHTGVRKLLLDKYPSIKHEFDIWHLSKTFRKKLATATKLHSGLAEWTESICNHVWYCAQNCQGNADKLTELFQSVLNHVSNIHTWEGKEVHGCAHGPIDANECRLKKWIAVGSQEYLALKSIIMDKRFIKDLRQCTNFLHTGVIEAFHSKKLKVAPKRIYIPQRSMVLKTILAILDHNYNVKRKIIGSRPVFSKATKKKVHRNIYTASSNEWRQKLIGKIIRNAVSPDTTIMTENTTFESVLIPYATGNVTRASRHGVTSKEPAPRMSRFPNI